jgi:hypothetical protein
VPDLTVVYYTSNREYPRFEEAIKARLLESIGDTPLISVSQKPIDFGQNICVGDIGASEMNIVRQLRTGAKAATTKFVAPVESDCLYPPDFFEYRPESTEGFHYAADSYIIWHGANTFWKKPLREFSSIVGRDYLIRALDLLPGTPARHFPETLAEITTQKTFPVSAPVVTIKTRRQMHQKHPYARRRYKGRLPLWGTGAELWEAYPCE